MAATWIVAEPKRRRTKESILHEDIRSHQKWQTKIPKTCTFHLSLGYQLFFFAFPHTDEAIPYGSSPPMKEKLQKSQACVSGCKVKSISTLCGPMTTCQTLVHTYSLHYCCNSVSSHKMGREQDRLEGTRKKRILPSGWVHCAALVPALRKKRLNKSVLDMQS